MSSRGLALAALTSVAVWTAAVFAVAAPGPPGPQAPRGAKEDMSQFLPPGAGKTLVARECSTCHDLRGVVRLRMSKEKWEAVVFDMVARGAPLMIEDADAITAYLSDVFGPKAPPLVDANTATRADFITLPGVSPALADRLLAHRKEKGLFTSRDEVGAAAGLDQRVFEKIKWYLRVQRTPPSGQ